MRELNWNGLFMALDVVIRYLIPCESFTLFLVEDRGKYVRKVNSYLEAFPPERRGSPVDAVTEATLEGSAAISVEPCSLPSRALFATDWATREATSLAPMPGIPTADDVEAGMIRRWATGAGEDDGVSVAPVVDKVHNVVAWPMRFGTPEQDVEDPFADYSSSDSKRVGADETVFGVMKLTNRLAERPRAKKLQFRRVQTHSSRRNQRDDQRYKPFTEADLRLLNGLTRLLRELYFAIDPLTFGPSIERSLDLGNGDAEPLNGPSLQGKSIMSSRSLPSGGSRMLEAGSHGASAGGLFGVLGSAFAKSASQRRRAPELPDLVRKPVVTVTSDSTESMRNAPGWIHKEWTEEDLESIAVERAQAGKRRIGGITLLATWKLRDDVVVDPYCVICRFQLRLRRTSHARAGHQVWRSMPPFFCIAPDEVTQQYCAFLTEYLQYGEDYVVSVRAGSADRWGEWSADSDVIRFEASSLQPRDSRQRLGCNLIGPQQGPKPQGPVDPYSTHDHLLKFTWQAFVSFDPQTPLPIEYCVEAWQREDGVGSSTVEQLSFMAMDHTAGAGKPRGIQDRLPNAGLDWWSARRMVVATMESDATADSKLEFTVECRHTSLVPGSDVYFGVRARYLTLPGTSDWCEAVVFTSESVTIPDVTPSLPAPCPVLAEEFDEPDNARGRSAPISPRPDSVVVGWPFINPASFCARSPDGESFVRGTFAPNGSPSDFPLPFRLQCRTLTRVDLPNTDGKRTPMSWSAWREVRSYDFVRRQIPAKLSSQLDAAHPASRGDYFPEATAVNSPQASTRSAPLRAATEVLSGPLRVMTPEPELDGECLDPSKDPLGLLTEHWALQASGLSLVDEECWHGLVQLRWISSSVEGIVSAPSPVLCTEVSGLVNAPTVQHLVVNCSAGSKRGKNLDELEASTAAFADESVVHELRHVARLTFELDGQASSFAFVRFFGIRYKEAFPGLSLDDAQWMELPPAPITNAQDVTVDATKGIAEFRFDLTEVPLVRHHVYEFSIRVCSNEHVSAWSPGSVPLHLMLPEVLSVEPPSLAGLSSQASALTPSQQVSREVPVPLDEDEASESQGRETPMEIADEALSPDGGAIMSPRGHAGGEEGGHATPPLLFAEVCCNDVVDASRWHVLLTWRPFLYAGDGLGRFPTLKSLPVEFQFETMLKECAPDFRIDSAAILHHTDHTRKVADEFYLTQGRDSLSALKCNCLSVQDELADLEHNSWPDRAEHLGDQDENPRLHARPKQRAQPGPSELEDKDSSSSPHAEPKAKTKSKAKGKAKASGMPKAKAKAKSKNYAKPKPKAKGKTKRKAKANLTEKGGLHSKRNSESRDYDPADTPPRKRMRWRADAISAVWTPTRDDLEPWPLTLDVEGFDVD